MAQLNYSNKNTLMGAMIIAGWDEEAGGQVWGCPISGTLVKEPWAIDGSGSTFIWGFLDSEFRQAGPSAQHGPAHCQQPLLLPGCYEYRTQAIVGHAAAAVCTLQAG